MKKLIVTLALLSPCISFATTSATVISGDPARALFAALMQADLKPTNITGPDGNFPGQVDILDQKVILTNLSCKLAYDQIGTLLGTCTLNDVQGVTRKLGSAASSQIMTALPDGYSDGALGHFRADAKAITCEIDTRIADSTGTAVATCTLQPITTVSKGN